ncbi:MAG: NTP transferase domain-containing protein [Ardenticatenaceae bacterium]|nr:NTP transferase domain-containing protein [Ardenticatenaceae bacterium]MCB9446266.1 NTP transferase domain-containing protein [Ardenticatenaceae bacterium]
MDCIVVAGGVPQEEDLLYEYTQGKPKALLEMNGRTMLERVVNALQSARQIDEIVVIGLGSDMGQTFLRPVHHLPGQGNLINNAIAGVDWIMQHKPDTQAVMLSSADIPLLTGELVDALIEMCRPFDQGVYYSFVTKETMEARFPGSKRTFTKLKGVEVAGGDLGIIQPDILLNNRALWEALSNARKHAWQIAREVGIMVLLKLLTRQLSIADIEQLAERLTGMPSRVLLNPYAEMGMDGDKPHQIDLLRAELKRLEG